MSCLIVNKLLPARKAWKIFTNKVQTKLHKLHKSKAIKKPRNVKTSKRISWPTFCLLPRVQRKRFKPKASHKLCGHTYYFQKRPSPVYIDQLFIEPISVVKEHVQPPTKAQAAYKQCRKETCSSSTKKAELADLQENIAGTSIGDGWLKEDTNSADDMWESLVLTSPQMNGINERAEEFITRFRAEMQLQERLTHRL